MDKGLVHIYCGDGKGKTTAAAGLAIRCAGGGGRVLFYQFLKDGRSGEINVLKNIDNITVVEGYSEIKFSCNMTEEEKNAAKQHYTEKLRELKDRVSCQNYDMLVLDEACGALSLGYISKEDLLLFIKNKPVGLELVLTGRNPCESLIENADYVSEIKKIKHPFDKGISARKYIEL